MPEPVKLAEPHDPRTQRFAALMLVLATLCWGFGFTWAKAGGETINRASGAGAVSPLGPILLLGARFTIAGLLWLMIFPAARRGWAERHSQSASRKRGRMLSAAEVRYLWSVMSIRRSAPCWCS